MQQIFVGLLHAVLADVAGAAVAGGIDGLELTLVDAAHVAQHVGGLLAQGVSAQQGGADVHAGEAVAVDGKTRHLLSIRFNNNNSKSCSGNSS